MWPLIAAGILTSALCIDACVTVVIVVISVVAVALSKPIPDGVERPVTRSSSARRASTVEGESEKVDEVSKTEKKEEVAPTKREMTANPRRPVPNELKPATETVAPKQVHAAPSHGAFLGARGKDAQLRLMQAMKKEMLSARLHQFERPRITTPPTE